MDPRIYTCFVCYFQLIGRQNVSMNVGDQIHVLILNCHTYMYIMGENQWLITKFNVPTYNFYSIRNKTYKKIYFLFNHNLLVMFLM